MRLVEDVDAALNQTRERLMAADAAGDETAVAAIWIRLDDLLDQRIRLPLQRRTPEDPP